MVSRFLTAASWCSFLSGDVEGMSTQLEHVQRRRSAVEPPPFADGGADRPVARFQSLVCEYFACAPEAYEGQLFRRSLHWHVAPIAAALAKWNPAFFSEDTGLIADLASATSHAEVLSELNRFYGRNVRDRNWLRKTFSLRISGKRVLRLSRRLFLAS